MDGGDGWHAAAGGGGGKEKTVINRIMLRYRPIAPRPILGASCSGEIVPEGKNKSLYSPSKRVKRKYIRTKKGSRSSTGDPQGGVMDSTTITLQLLPGERRSGDTSGSRSWLSIDQAVEKYPHSQDHLWVNTRTLNSWPEITDAVAGSDRRLVAAAPVVAVESWVTVESVTDTCMDVRGLGCTDREKAGSLEKDTCPGFISDGFNRVQWVNEAYKDMVRQGGNYYCDGQSPEVRVWLVTKAELPANGHSAFSCRVRLQYMCQKEKCSKMVPCDVWRMQEGAGLAWRLDMKAALSLGL
ncbi:uncharacterized protein LOC133726715 isoform X2 [Rosa rugosa]|uniref:uncharacterized protein LOC133726715 isoform X2 n=1 Tax=Rosa rugosa TaxID=74645 RepID=UPI002B40F312|nr:uncharacterized protein LOC133726715 isoform X2 [Rosa rugosa]